MHLFDHTRIGRRRFTMTGPYAACHNSKRPSRQPSEKIAGHRAPRTTTRQSFVLAAQCERSSSSIASVVHNAEKRNLAMADNRAGGESTSRVTERASDISRRVF